MLQGFKKFILRGNVIDLAVGVIIGASFNSVVTALVKDLFNPFLSLLFTTPNLAHMSVTVRGSTFLYGDFFNALISFLLTAVAIYFFFITPINALVARMRTAPPADPTTKKCPECLSEIPRAAKRCAQCGQAIA